MKINIPEILIDLRAQVVDQERHTPAGIFNPLNFGMRVAAALFSRAWLFHAAQRVGRIGARLFTGKDGWIHSLPSVGGKWTQTRDLRGFPQQTFREWFQNRPAKTGQGAR